jgi:two-component system phosphate regulon response regulator PhoB
MDALSARLLLHVLGAPDALPPDAASALEAAGIRLVFASTRAALAKIAVALPPDALVLAGAAPRAALVETLRRQYGRRGLPVLALIRDEGDAASRLEAGVDDALPSALAPALLVARIETAVRRRERAAAVPARGRLATPDQHIVLDLRGLRCLLREGGRYNEVLLTRRQFDTLAALIRAKTRPVAWAELYDDGWRPARLRKRSRTLVQHVIALRRKLGPHGARISAVPGIGYRLGRASSPSPLI